MLESPDLEHPGYYLLPPSSRPSPFFRLEIGDRLWGVVLNKESSYGIQLRKTCLLVFLPYYNKFKASPVYKVGSRIAWAEEDKQKS